MIVCIWPLNGATGVDRISCAEWCRSVMKWHYGNACIHPFLGMYTCIHVLRSQGRLGSNPDSITYWLCELGNFKHFKSWCLQINNIWNNRKVEFTCWVVYWLSQNVWNTYNNFWPAMKVKSMLAIIIVIRRLIGFTWENMLREKQEGYIWIKLWKLNSHLLTLDRRGRGTRKEEPPTQIFWSMF